MHKLIIIFLFFFSINSFAYAANIDFVVGDVNIERKGKIIPAAPRLKLFEKDKIFTLKNSFAIVKITKSKIIKIRPETSLILNKFVITGAEENINLLKGSIFSKVLKSKNLKFRVKIRTIVASIRGTEFFIAYGKKQNNKHDLWLCVNEGKVVVKNLKRNKSVIVKEGEGIFILGSDKITKPKEYAWTKKLNWNIDPKKGDIKDKTNLKDAYTDVLDQDYD